MKRLMSPAVTAVALIIAATAMQWSHSNKLSAETAAMPSLQEELHAAAGVNKLPTEAFVPVRRRTGSSAPDGPFGTFNQPARIASG
jgi:hypothetical protein